MFEMKVHNAVNSIVEAMFPMPKGEGLFVMLDLRLEHPKNEKKRAFGNVCFVFERPYNYCKVFTSTSRVAWDVPDISTWTMISDHDSCWRDAVDQQISKEYFAQARAISDKMAPVRMRQWAYIHRIDRVKLEYEVVDPRDTYMKRLTKLEIVRK